MIEDDLDDFLNTLEDCEEDTTKTILCKTVPNNKRHTKPTVVTDDDLDDILNDPEFSSDIGTTKKPSYLSINKKCNVVYLGKSTTQTSCSHTRCSDCDCAVVCFRDHVWTEEVEYLFLRNNYPDFDRMKEKLKSKSDSHAYACQCNSVTVETQLPVKSLKSSLKWFCGSH